MSLKVGIDFVLVETVRAAVQTQGNRYLQRVFTPREIADCHMGAMPDLPDGLDARKLAIRFAAKEATFKALRVGDTAVSWQDVELELDETGSLSLSLHDRAATLAEQSGVRETAVSVTEERGLAGAVVIAEIATAADKERHD